MYFVFSSKYYSYTKCSCFNAHSNRYYTNIYLFKIKCISHKLPKKCSTSKTKLIKCSHLRGPILYLMRQIEICINFAREYTKYVSTNFRFKFSDRTNCESSELHMSNIMNNITYLVHWLS